MFSAINLSRKFQCFVKVLVLYSLIFTLVPPICQFYSPNCCSLLLQRDYSFLRDINVWHPFVLIGVYSSTLSAAMSNLIGASRVLYAMAKDDLFGRWLYVFFVFFSKGRKISTETIVTDISVFKICQEHRCDLLYENATDNRENIGVCFIAVLAARQSTVYLQLQRNKHSLKILR